MKTKMSLIFATLVVLLGTMIWVVQDRRSMNARSSDRGYVASPVPAPAAVIPVAAAAPTTVTRTEPMVPQAAVTASGTTPSQVVSETPAAPMVHVAASGAMKYTARDGDTLSQLAVALLGTDTQEHRDAVIAANASLQADPDRVLEGQVYTIAPTAAAVTTIEAPAEVAAAKETPATPVSSGPKLQYTAQPGDTVSGLATNLLGADTKANRAGIVEKNPSLKDDPDHLVAGQTYTIVARNGLASEPAAATTLETEKTPAARPAVAAPVTAGVGHTLRYTARAGDTMSEVTTALLGSDSAANRETVTLTNPSLKANPDQLVAGQVYWVAAPGAGDAAP